MKSVIIKQDGKMVIHIKRTKNGVDTNVLSSLRPFIGITVVMNNNERITINPKP